VSVCSFDVQSSSHSHLCGEGGGGRGEGLSLTMICLPTLAGHIPLRASRDSANLFCVSEFKSYYFFSGQLSTRATLGKVLQKKKLNSLKPKKRTWATRSWEYELVRNLSSSCSCSLKPFSCSMGKVPMLMVCCFPPAAIVPCSPSTARNRNSEKSVPWPMSYIKGLVRKL
jgi:hypothetical protein